MDNTPTIRDEIFKALEDIASKANKKQGCALTNRELQILLVSSLLEEEC